MLKLLQFKLAPTSVTLAH